MNKSLLPVFLLFLLVSGCIKDCQQKFLPDSIKPFLFKQGSQWVFSNPISGVNDTFVVVSHKSEIIHGLTPIRCKGDAQNEIFEMTVVNRLDTFRVSAHSVPYIYFSNKGNTIQGGIFDSSIPTGECSTYNSRLCLNGISSLTVGANTFNEVYEVTTPLENAHIISHVLCDLFWVKNVGVVKVVLHDSNSSTFNLLSWNVVQ